MSDPTQQLAWAGAPGWSALPGVAVKEQPEVHHRTGMKTLLSKLHMHAAGINRCPLTWRLPACVCWRRACSTRSR
jgi:aminoglycoside phosphotransferase